MDGFGSLQQLQPGLLDVVFWFWNVWLCVNIIEPAQCLKHLWVLPQENTQIDSFFKVRIERCSSSLCGGCGG